MNTGTVDSYLLHGCGRCDKYETPACKVHLWTDVLVGMRAILTATELDEQLKWGAPCYSIDGTNVIMFASTVNYCAISFFKGYALDDPDGILTTIGPNSRIARVVKFHGLDEFEQLRDATAAMVQQAIDLQKSGDIPAPPPAEFEIPEELQDVLDADPQLHEAFEALTPGRQRSHVLHIAGAKQAQTRARRAEKCIPKIFAGKGFNEY